MNKSEGLKEFDEIKKLCKINQYQYIKKDEFIKLIENLRFYGIEKASLDLITCFEYDTKDNICKTKSYHIELY